MVMKWFLFLGLVLILFTPVKSSADGCFVAPKFVWDKHKDINEPTQKAIIVYDAGHEDLILQVKYEGPTDQFGWLIPVPNRPAVSKGSMKYFYELSRFTQRREQTSMTSSFGADGTKSTEKPEPPVKVIETKTVGAYKIAVLSTKNSGALTKWLDDNHYYFPTNKTDVLDYYIKQQWYFVAVKINLVNSLFSFLGTADKLADGELNPLQISFASDRCVFPLKISSVNGTPSEIQVYVLSPEPLLEKGMLEAKLPQIYTNDVARAASQFQSFKDWQARVQEGRAQLGLANSSFELRRNAEIQKMYETIYASPKELLAFIKATKTDLPDSAQWIPRLAGKTWWITKETWTFQPEEMHDLFFESAFAFFANELGTKYGYFAAASLAQFDTDADPTLIVAFGSSNAVARVNAAAALEHYTHYADPQMKQAAVAWLTDSEPKVRMAAVDILADYSSWDPKYAAALVPVLRDNEWDVRHDVARNLVLIARNHDDFAKYVPEFQQMLKGTNPAAKLSGLEMLEAMKLPVDRADRLSCLGIPNREGFSIAVQSFLNEKREYDISNQEVIPLLKNSDPLARLVALKVIYQNADKESVELALPLLHDPEMMVQSRAAATLRALTGQHFTDEQSAEWEQWWTENKTNFVVQLHPEELRPRHRPISNATNGPSTE